MNPANGLEDPTRCLRAPGPRPGGLRPAAGSAVRLFLLLAFLLPLRAEVLLDVFPGFEGFVHADHWFPVAVEVQNTGENLETRIELRSGSQGVLSQVLEEPFPQGTRKRFLLSAFAPGRNFSEVRVRVTTKEGRILAEKESSVVTLSEELPLIACLPGSSSGAARLPVAAETSRDRQAQLARINRAHFPINSLALEGLNTLLLHAPHLGAMLPDQVEALISWVRGGGHLVLYSEQVSDFPPGSPILPRLPLVPTGTVAVSPGPALHEWVRSTPAAPRLGFSAPVPELSAVAMGRNSRNSGEVRPEFRFADIPLPGFQAGVEVPGLAGKPVADATILFEAHGRPLATARDEGRGRITLLSWNPEREPLRTAPGIGHFWAALAGVPSHVLDGRAGYAWKLPGFDAVAAAVTETEQIRKLPVGILLLVLLVYIGVIGPFDRWLIRRTGRPLLTWITFPAYVLVFSALIYGIGYVLRAGKTEWNELHVVDILDVSPTGPTRLRGRSFGTVYSPANETYRIEGDSGPVLFRNHLGRSGNMTGPGDLVVRLGDGAVRAEFPVPVWTSRAVVGEWERSAPSPLETRVLDSGKTLEVVNRSPKAIRTIWVVHARRVFGTSVPVPPGGVARIPLGEGAELQDFLESGKSEMERVLEFQSSNFGRMGDPVRFPDPGRTLVAASLLSMLPADTDRTGPQSWRAHPEITRGAVGQDLGVLAEMGRDLVFAWQDDASPLPDLHRFEAPRHRKATCFRLVVPAAAPQRP